MTDEDLIARLRESTMLHVLAADRIAALVKANREDAMELIAAHGQAQDAYEAQLKAEARVKRLEAALSAAKEYIEELEWHYGGGATELTRKYRAALEGNTHDA